MNKSGFHLEVFFRWWSRCWDGVDFFTTDRRVDTKQYLELHDQTGVKVKNHVLFSCLVKLNGTSLRSRHVVCTRVISLDGFVRTLSAS